MGSIRHHEGFAAGSGLRLHYTEWGDPEAEPVVLLHGLGGHGRVWEPVARTLAASYRCIAPDARGHGASDWAGPGGYVTDLHFADLVVFMEALRIERAAICGHSMGAGAAILLAACRPERCRALAVVDAYPDPEPSEGSDRIARFYASLPERFDSRDAAARAIGGAAHDGHEARSLDLTLRRLDDGSFGWRQDPAIRDEFRDWIRDGSGLRRADLWPFWREVRSTTLLVRGSRSSVLTPALAERMLREQPRARLAELDGGHALLLEQPAAVATTILDFLAETEETPSARMSGSPPSERNEDAP